MWTNTDNGRNVNWEQAKDHCRNLRRGSFNDWRLPRSNELAAMYEPRAGVPGYANGNPVSMQVKGSLRLSGSEWSSSQVTADEVLTNCFNGPCKPQYPVSYKRWYPQRALCVRSSKPIEESELQKLVADGQAAQQEQWDMNKQEENEQKNIRMRQVGSEVSSLGLRSGMSQARVKAALIAHAYIGPDYLASARPWVCASNGWKNGRLTTGCVSQKGKFSLAVVFEFGIEHRNPDTGRAEVEQMDRLFFAQFTFEVGSLRFSAPQYKNVACIPDDGNCRTF